MFKLSKHFFVLCLLYLATTPWVFASGQSVFREKQPAVSSPSAVTDARGQQNQTISLFTKQQTLSQNLLISAVFTGFAALLLILYLLHRRRVAVLQARANARLVAQKNQMLSDVSHELRTPLAVIKLQVELLEHELLDDPKIAFETVYSKISSLNRLINDVLQLALADSGELGLDAKPVNARPLLDDYFRNVAPVIADAGHTYDYVCDIDEAVEIRCDTGRIEQVLGHLITNSCRYTDGQGHIQVSVKSEQGQLSIFIEDSAPGIPAKYWPKVFNRLYRGDKSRSRKYGGVGLGLSLSKVFIKAHGGSIRLGDSKLGGLSVHIRLPITINHREI